MDYYELKTQLIATGEYRTVVRFRPLKYFASLAFYILTFLTVWSASRKSKRGKFDLKSDWPLSALSIINNCEKVGGKFDIRGLKNLRAVDGPVIFVGNHMSTLENFTLPMIIGSFKHLTFVVKKELLNFPIFGHIMKATEPIPLDRTNAKEDLVKVLSQGHQKLSKGISIVIFPQSTRLDEVRFQDFNTIGAKLAADSNVPIIPLAVKTKFWRNNKIKAIRDFGKICPQETIKMEFGTPLYLPDDFTPLDVKKINAAAVNFIVSCHEKWSKE